MKSKDALSSIACFSGGLAAAYQGYNLEIGSLSDPGSGFIFFWLGVIIVGLSGIVFFQALRKPHRARAPEALFNPPDLKRILIIIAVLVVYAGTLEYLGFVISTLFVMLFLFKLMGPQSWRTAIIGALVSSISAYLVFDIWLGCTLPSGLLQIG